jgi:hypothetical protein
MEREDENACLAASHKEEVEEGGTALAAHGDVHPVVVAEVDVGGGHRIRKLSVKVPYPQSASPSLVLALVALDVTFPRFPCQALTSVHACVCCVVCGVSRSRW